MLTKEVLFKERYWRREQPSDNLIAYHAAIHTGDGFYNLEVCCNPIDKVYLLSIKGGWLSKYIEIKPKTFKVKELVDHIEGMYKKNKDNFIKTIKL